MPLGHPRCPVPALRSAWLFGPGRRDAVSWNGTSWSAPMTIAGAQALQAVGCASSTLLRRGRRPGGRLLFQRIRLVGGTERLGERRGHLVSDLELLRLGQRRRVHLERELVDPAPGLRHDVHVDRRVLPARFFLRGGRCDRRGDRLEREQLVGSVAPRVRSVCIRRAVAHGRVVHQRLVLHGRRRRRQGVHVVRADVVESRLGRTRSRLHGRVVHDVGFLRRDRQGRVRLHPHLDPQHGLTSTAAHSNL